jgi:hypothetical protein
MVSTSLEAAARTESALVEQLLFPRARRAFSERECFFYEDLLSL